jgi:hypothetical protein
MKWDTWIHFAQKNPDAVAGPCEHANKHGDEREDICFFNVEANHSDDGGSTFL